MGGHESENSSITIQEEGGGGGLGLGLWETYAKPLAGGATAALIINRNASGPVNATVNFGACNVRCVHWLATVQQPAASIVFE